MSTTFIRAAAGGRLHRIALAGLVSLALVGSAGMASAQEATGDSSTTVTTTTEVTETPAPQEDDTVTPPSDSSETSTSTETEVPEPSLTPFDVSVLTDCYPDGYGEATVFLRIKENKDVTYTVELAGHDSQEASFSDEGGFYFAIFPDVAAGLHPVTVTGTDGSEVKTEANLENCREDQPRPDEQLRVSVKCVDGAGVVTIQVFNPDTEESRFLTIKIDDFGALPPYEEFEFFPDVVAKIVEIAEDGTYEIKLYNGDELIDSQSITVACVVATTTTTTTTTTAPPAQGSTPPAAGLPTTGAAVRGITVLGVIALLLGTTLVVLGRRRRATPEA